jgi:signal transduction histidine kinase
MFTIKEAGRSITIKDRQASVSIKDNGSGIDTEIEPKLFSKFVTNSPEGTGIGLFISKSKDMG